MLFLLLQTGLNPVQRDTLSRSLNHITDTLSKIVCNTNPQRFMDVELEFGNFWIGLISLVIGLLGAWFGWLAYRFSKKTADNVVRMTAENQLALFTDMIRHLYRNLICTLVMARNLSDSKAHNSYPSEDHLLKLKMLPEDTIHLEKYNDNKEIYRVMHELKLLLRNYDTEVDVCLLHYKDANISYEELIKDVSGLLFKPFYLMKRIVDIEDDIYKYEKTKKYSFLKRYFIKKGWVKIHVPDQKKIISEVIFSEHFAKLEENIEPEKFEKWSSVYQSVDYVHQEDLPLYDLARGIEKLKNFDYEVSFDWLLSDANANMSTSAKVKYKKEDIFGIMRNNNLFKDYLAVIDGKKLKLMDFVSNVISMDVAIEKGKIRFFEIKK